MQRYYVKRPTGKVFGPFDENAIQMMLENDKIGSDAEVSTDKQSWQPISEIAAFSGESSSDLPQSKSGGSAGGPPDLPTPKSDSGGGPPDLPTPKSGGGGGGPELPKPKSGGGGGPELPKPKSGGGGGPELPKPKGGTEQAELPRSTGDNLPRSGGGDLPRSSEDNLPRSGGGDLPRSSEDNLPRSGGGELPRSSEDNLPQSETDAPPASEPPEDDDLFGAPVEDEEEEEDLFEAPGVDEDSEDLFDAPGVDEDSEDLFAAPGVDEDSEDLFEGDAPPPEEEQPADQEEDLEEDDLFDAPEMEDDDLFAEAPEQQQDEEEDDDDFLGGDDSFAFLSDDDEEDDGGLEDWEEDIPGDDSFDPDALGEEDDDWGDDLLEDDDPGAAARRPESQSPSAQPAPQDDQFRPASTGIKDEERYGVGPSKPEEEPADEGVEGDRKRGLISIVGIALVGVLLFGGAGFGIYQGFLADDDSEQDDQGPQQVELPLDQIRSANYADLRGLIDRADTGELDDQNKARLLLVQSLFLTNYDDEDVAANAESLASELAGNDDDPTSAVALATYEAQNAEPDAARALAESVSDDPELGFFAHLAMGIGDAMAHLEGEEFNSTLDVDTEADTGEQRLEEIDQDGDDAEAQGDESAESDDGDDQDDEQEDEPAEESTEDAEDEEGESDEDAADESEDPESEQPAGDTEGEEFFASRAAEHFEAATEANGSSALPRYWLARLSLHVDDAESAIEHLESAVEADPTHVPSRLQAGRLYHQRGSLTNASDHLQEINDNLASDASDDERAEALHLMGLVHQARQESSEAIDFFTRALSADSSRVDTLRALAEEYERAERYEDALNFFTTDEQLRQEDPEVVLGIVRSYIGLERWTAAVDKLEESLEQFPDDARFPYNLGRLQEERRNFREARSAYERAIDIDPDHLEARAAMARLSWRIDQDATEGDRHVAAIVERPDQIDADLANEVADFYHLSDRPDLARQWNEEALRLDPNYWEARLALARIYLDQQETQRALELLEHAREEGIQDLRLSAYLADAYRQNEQFDRAIDEINSVLQHEDAEDAEYIYIRGRIHFDRGNFATAQEDFTNAYDLNPQFHDAYFYVGRSALAQESYNQAIRVFRHVLDYQPESGRVHYYLGRAYEADGSTNQALNSYSNAINTDPEFVDENPDVLVRRGLIRARIGRVVRAQRDIQRAIEKEPDNPEALMAIASLNFDEGNYEAAIQSYAQVLEEDSEHPQAQYELGMSYVHEDNEEEGARHLQLAVRHGYEDPEVYKTLGYLYQELGRRSDALDAFQTFIRETEDEEIAASTQSEVLQQIEELGG